MEDDWHYLIEEEDLSYYSGPLSADAVVLILNLSQDDDAASDETDYDFSYSGINQNTIATNDIPYFLSEENDVDDGDFDYSYGPLPPDVVVADLVANQFDDVEAVDETDYDFSNSLQDSIAVLADIAVNQFDDDETLDETDYSFSSWQQDDAAIVASDYIQAWLEDEQTEEFDYDFSAFQQDVVAAPPDQINSVFDDSEDEPVDLDFTTSPLSADFTFSFDIPCPAFDEYDETFDGDEYSFYLGSVAAPSGDIPPPSYVVGGSFLSGRKRKKKHDEIELTQPEPLEIVVLGKAPNEIITGLVIPKRKTAKEISNAIETTKAHKLRNQQIADDEWLLLN